MSRKHSTNKSLEITSFLRPMLASLTSTDMSPYSESTLFNYPRLTAPRDLSIPSSVTNVRLTDNYNVSMPSTEESSRLHLNDVYLAKPESETVDIWELASQVDKDIPNDIWDVASKLPIVKERTIIASLPREIALWQQKYDGNTGFVVLSERFFIKQIMYLIIGIETKEFPFDTSTNRFYMRDNVSLEGVSQQLLKDHINQLLLVGTYYKRLYMFAFNQTLEDYMHKKGLIYEAARDVVRTYLLGFRLRATQIFEDFYNTKADDLNCMPTLLQISMHMQPLKYEIGTVASIYNMTGRGLGQSLPLGAELMSYLFDKISLVTHIKTSLVTYNFLYSICKIYFKFIEIFAFQGELDDKYDEFFIRKDCQYANSRTKKYWDRGFHMAQGIAVPDFLRSLAKYILLCGKSLRLLKLCNSSDPLIVLMSSDHPTIKACYNFEQLDRQQRILDVYRTRCLFVSGEPVTFAQIMLKREAEKKAFCEMATLKQAETMEKIISERKRLARLILAEKQHSFKVLEAAMAEAEAAKKNVKHQEKVLSNMKTTEQKLSDQIDARLKDKERNEIIEYYSKLNMEVEKSKIHTEWKMKRLQLDQARMQLLSTEERTLKREKLELEHKKNEDVMAMSIQSFDSLVEKDDFNVESDNELIAEFKSKCYDDSADNTILQNVKEGSIENKSEDYKTKADSPKNVFSALYSVAKSIFRASKHDDSRKSICSDVDLDSEGNVIGSEKSSEFISTSNETYGRGDIANLSYQHNIRRQEAIKNKEKNMSHIICSVDEENNIAQNETYLITTKVDEENNIDKTSTSRFEAKRNKLKVLGDEFGIVTTQVKYAKEPITEAQKEAVLNKQKVLGVEYNLPMASVTVREPANQAQKEALKIKNKMTVSEINNQDETIYKHIEPKNVAQEEAIAVKRKILGTSHNVIPKHISLVESNVDQKKIGTEITSKETSSETAVFSSGIQKQSMNRNKMLSSEFDTRDRNTRRDRKRSTLTLNLKPLDENAVITNLGPTPDTGAFTPAGFFPRLDLETPTTAEIPLGVQDDECTPHSEGSDHVNDTSKHISVSGGLDYTLIDDDEVTDTDENHNLESEEFTDSSTKHEIIETPTVTNNKFSIFEIIDGAPKVYDIDPFGVKKLNLENKSCLSSRMDLDSVASFYTHPSVLMKEVKSKPDMTVFLNDDEDRITNDNIATLTACLQKSVMLPLTYQLELVNNATLTHFLVNLDLYEHLSCMRDYFFLMDGEFSKSICRNLFAKLEKTTNPQELLNFATLHNILDKALGSSFSHPQKFTEHLSFLITECPLSFQHSSPDVLQCLSLTYTVEWPLNIILSQEALLRYSKVFHFLIKMRRTFWILGQTFERLKMIVKLCHGNPRNLLRSPQYISLQLYRHIMASLIRALDNYIVNTCILSSWTEFEADLKKARTLDDLYDCHVVYVKKVMFRCLLNNRSTPVMKLLNDIFTIIIKFCRVLMAGEWHEDDSSGLYTHTNYIQLVEIYHLHEKLVKYLHRVINKLMECGYQRHLIELLTMVNLNGYYDPDKSKEESISA